MTTTEEIVAKAAFDYSEGVDVDFAAIAAEVRGQLAELDALQADTLPFKLRGLRDRWTARSLDALPVDAMLINKMRRELDEIIGATQGAES